MVEIIKGSLPKAQLKLLVYKWESTAVEIRN